MLRSSCKGLFIVWVIANGFYGCRYLDNSADCVYDQLHHAFSDTIFLDLRSPTQWGMAQWIPDGDEGQLWLDNQINRSIDVYQYTRGHFELQDRIKIEAEGPKGLRQIQGFTVHGDSLMIFDRMLIHNALLYSQCVFQRLFTRDHFQRVVDASSAGHGIYNHLSISIGPTYLRGQTLHLAQWPLISLNDLEGLRAFEHTKQVPLKDTLAPMASPIPLPNVLTNGRYYGAYGLRFSRIIQEDGTEVHCWGGSDSLYILRPDLSHDVIPLTTCHKYPMYEGSTHPQDYADADKQYIYHLHHLGVFYDTFREITYIASLLPYGEEGKQEMDAQVYHGRDVIISGYDTAFEKVSETHIEGGIYDIHGLFFTEQGLYLPRNNPTNETVQEDYIVMDVYH